MQETHYLTIIKDYLPWIMSIITLYSAFLAGSYKKHAWLVGLGNQLLWSTWIITIGAWGLLPMNLALWFIYGRNHMKWNQKEDPAPVEKEPLDLPEQHAGIKPRPDQVIMDLGPDFRLPGVAFYDEHGLETSDVYLAKQILCGSLRTGYYMVDPVEFTWEKLSVH